LLGVELLNQIGLDFFVPKNFGDEDGQGVFYANGGQELSKVARLATSCLRKPRALAMALRSACERLSWHIWASMGEKSMRGFMFGEPDGFCWF
jgi:hypothetical protein